MYISLVAEVEEDNLLVILEDEELLFNIVGLLGFYYLHYYLINIFIKTWGPKIRYRTAIVFWYVHRSQHVFILSVFINTGARMDIRFFLHGTYVHEMCVSLRLTYYP